jgi:DNA-binding winged helix-turn-helix (wHTH) protein/tetratricopeptide (TPR) repeat protein
VGEWSVIYRFGDHSIDDDRLELRRESRILEVQPKVLDLLIHLIRERERVVSQRELLDSLWGDAAVVAGVLTTAVHEARVALGDSARLQWAIKTVPRRGYRFVAPVEEEPDPVEAEPLTLGDDPWMADVFVGRTDALARFEAGLDAAAAGRGRTIVVTGEPGIGKTRLLDELASRARSRGGQVLAAWCYEGEGSPPYWPWAQILRAAIAEQRPEDALLDMGAGAADLASLVPLLHELRPDLPEPPRLQSGPSRFRLFESIATFLANAAKRRPILILIDDLHSADHASLRLLSFLVRGGRHERILTVVAVREGESQADAVFQETLADLARHSPGERVRLEGLSPTETEEFIRRLTGLESSRAVTRAIAERSEGNPFLVKEIVSLLQTQGPLEEEPESGTWLSSIPPGVRDVILRRSRRRSPTCQKLLALSSVLGREFRRELLERLAVLEGGEFAAGLDEACATGFLHECPTREGHYRFTHALTQETLYAESSAGELIRWHGRAGEALEALAASGQPPASAELAHHFLKASEGGDVGKAVHYAVRAAEDAVAVHAHSEAARYYGRALEALERLESPDDVRRCELLLALGTAQLDARSSDPSGRQSLLRAAQIAREVGDCPTLARAALELAGTVHQSSPGDPVVIELLEGALAGLDRGDQALRARVMADLAIQRSSGATREQDAWLSEDAVALARKTADPATLGEILNLRCTFLSGPEHIRERLRQADALLDLAGETHSTESARFGHRWRLVSMLELGEMEAADRELEAYERAAGEGRTWAARWYALTLRATRAFVEGRLDEAERLAFDALAQRRQEVTPLAVHTFGAQLLWLRKEQGRLGEAGTFERTFPRNSRFPTLAVFRATMALLKAERGSLDEAREELQRIAVNRLDDLPHDFTYLYDLAVLSELCATVGDSDNASIAYDALLPFADRHVVLFMGTVCLGSVERYLGQLAATMGEWERSEAHFAEALQCNQRVGARLWVAHTQLDWARMLYAQGGGDASAPISDLLRPCVATAAELGLKALEEKAQLLVAQVRGAVSSPTGRQH